MSLLVGLPVHGYHEFVFLKRLPIQLYIFRPQAASTPLGTLPLFTHARDDVVCDLNSGFHFIFWVHFNLTAKGLKISCQLPPETSGPHGFIIIIIIIIIIAITIIIVIVMTIIITIVIIIIIVIIILNRVIVPSISI